MASGTYAPDTDLTVRDTNGLIVSGGLVWTYLAGTVTPAATYTDVGLLVANTNPIVANSQGRFTAFLSPGASYKFVYELAATPPAHGTVIITRDNISAVPGSSANLDITGTAGEALTAGQAVYLSDGSGGKNTGQWYKADAANGYSSSLPEVGMVPASISSGSSGTIRLGGQMTGLSVVNGSAYYVGTAGAITATATGRRLGVADSTTTLVLKDVLPIAPWANDFRLTLTTAVPVTTSDVTAATSVFCSPYIGNRIDLPDSNGNPVRVTSAEFSIAVPATTSQMYDVFAFNNSGVATLELLAWTNDTTRATAIIRTANGRLYKTGDLTRLYLGSVRTTTVSGQTEDSLTKRYLWNYYNRVRRPLKKVEATASWTWATAAWHQVNAAATNQIDFVVGVSEDPVQARALAVGSNGAVTAANIGTALGLDSATVPSGTWAFVAAWDNGGTAGASTVSAFYEEFPGVGRHFLAWLEFGNTNTVTYYGTGTQAGSGGGSPAPQTGITGAIIG